MKLKRRKPRARGHVGVRVRVCEVGALEGSEQSSDRIRLIYGWDPSGCHAEDGLQRLRQKQGTSWELMVAWIRIQADKTGFDYILDPK